MDVHGRQNLRYHLPEQKESLLTGFVCPEQDVRQVEVDVSDWVARVAVVDHVDRLSDAPAPIVRAEFADMEMRRLVVSADATHNIEVLKRGQRVHSLVALLVRRDEGVVHRGSDASRRWDLVVRE